MKNPPFYSFTSLLIVLLTPFVNNPDFSRGFTIFIISFVSSLEIINVVKLDPDFFLWIAASVTEAAAVNPNGIKTLLSNGLSTFPIKCNPVFNNHPKSLPKNLPTYTILCN